MKKLLCILLTFALLTTFVSAMAENVEFSDFSLSHWAYNNVSEMVNKGVIEGYPDGTFRPESNVTRGEFCAMLSKVANLYVDANVTGNHWAVLYAEAIKKATWTYKDWYLKNADLDAMINRGEAALGICDVYLGYPQSLIFKMAEVNSYLQTSYKDFSNIGGFAECVYTLSKNGIMNGYEDGCFHPEYPITRAELCAILSRAFVKNSNSENQYSPENNRSNTNYVAPYAYYNLKNALITKGTKTSDGTAYGFYNYADDIGKSDRLSTSVIYNTVEDNIGFLFTRYDGNIKTVLIYLFLSDDDVPCAGVEMYSDVTNDYIKFLGKYDSSKISVVSSDLPSLNERYIKLINSAFKTFDAMLNLHSINIKISDFGIDY